LQSIVASIGIRIKIAKRGLQGVVALLVNTRILDRLANLADPPYPVADRAVEHAVAQGGEWHEVKPQVGVLP
jgi:hypothetical protein